MGDPLHFFHTLMRCYDLNPAHKFEYPSVKGAAWVDFNVCRKVFLVICAGWYSFSIMVYKATKYSRKYLAEHEAELADYRAAKATMGELLGGEKLPKMAELKEKRRQLAAQKKALYTEYRSAQEEMRQAVAVKANIDHLLGVTDGQRKKEQER